MKAVMLMFDSLNREMLEPYGCDWVKTPNFRRLAEHSVCFDQCYAGSLPCMPARRELQTGRYNMLHRSWGPMEPFDDSMPELLKNNNIYTHLISDHVHYWEDGGATYHYRYNSWENIRGQEGDMWKCLPELFAPCDESKLQNKDGVYFHATQNLQRHDAVNRKFMKTEEDTALAKTIHGGLEFIDTNHDCDRWFLQIECFDPHEPFYTLPKDKELYPHHFEGDAAMEADWPPYAPAVESENTIEHVRYNYAALVSKCDRYLGKVLDVMDKYNLWEDTMLIVNTDHGFLLGEHGWWGKTSMPIYNEIAHTPLFIYDPRRADLAGEKCNSIVQTIDLAPTLLEYFGMEIPKDMEGKPLKQVMDDDTPIREYAIFGYHGSQVDVTDGRYVYMHAADHQEEKVYEYTLMPTHMRQMFQPEELQNIELAGPFSFTKGCKVMKIEKKDMMGDTTSFGNMLFDLNEDPTQNTQIHDEAVEMRMKGYIREYMEKNDAPKELYKRLGL